METTIINWIETPIGLTVAETPITQAQWLSVMERGTQPERLWDVCGDDIPATHITWDEANEFAAKVSGRLPTSDEFLKLALAGAAEMPEDIENYAVFGMEQITPVKTKLPNVWGLYDLAGLVWEWCSDGAGNYRYLRGGSWSNFQVNARAVYCFNFNPLNRYDNFGFRVVTRE